MEPTDIFPVVRMPPRKSTPVVIVTPERLAALDDLAKGPRYVERITALEAEVERLLVVMRDIKNGSWYYCPSCDVMAGWPHAADCALIAALEPAPAEEERDG